MSRYFLHARLGEHVIFDGICIDLHDVTNGRNLISEVLQESRLNLSLDWVFDIADENGRIVLVVPLAALARTQRSRPASLTAMCNAVEDSGANSPISPAAFTS